jgi:enoyl-CoA hydratase/carnithine racemase
MTKTVEAAYAERIGLVTKVTADQVAAAEKLADRIATRSPHAVAGAERLFDRSRQPSARRTFAIERATQLPLILRLTGALGNNLAKDASTLANRGRKPPISLGFTVSICTICQPVEM